MGALKYSRQRESIKEFLASRKDHPNADTVYENIRQIYPNISLGTVYRNLALLESIGEIMKITTGDGADRYDGNVKPHHHFICTRCHSVIDLDMENIDYIKEAASKNFNGSIDNYIAHFYGLCENCSASPNDML
ncbi:Fur family transcriptional regulator [Ruminococcus gauvreauii]|uniref:Transcriptional repressor n=1 Tax=Ruminococcus gauvreauii TaxID=438033 RepID=A0ABY5VM13_9FIRM|nr:transcriptional repressor [Ruminococcus gauvreauii]UWP61231.1 transcriptional repressor [Ruminococcus gauvreauii]